MPFTRSSFWMYCIPGKCRSLNFPKEQIDENVMPDFARGYIEGDGCLLLHATGSCGVSFSSYSSDFVQELAHEIHWRCDLKNKVARNVHVLREGLRARWCGRKDVHKILKWMYGGSSENVRLNRKFERAQFIMGQQKNNREENIRYKLIEKEKNNLTMQDFVRVSLDCEDARVDEGGRFMFRKTWYETFAKTT